MRGQDRLGEWVGDASVALAFAAGAAGARVLAQPLTDDKAFFVFSGVAVVGASILRGWRCAVLCLLFAQVLVWLLVVDPVGSLEIEEATSACSLVLSILAGLALIAALGWYQKRIETAWQERDAIDQARELVTRELSHRVKNTLAVVQSMSRNSFREQANGDVAKFEQRLMALARANDLLIARKWSGATVAEIVDQSLEPFDAATGTFHCDGPEVRVTPEIALDLAMGLHELATNAAKYGALSVGTGTVTVTWRVSDGRKFALQWVERGGPPVTQPERNGFGVQLLTRALAARMKGTVDVRFAREGLECVAEGVLPGGI